MTKQEKIKVLEENGWKYDGDRYINASSDFIWSASISNITDEELYKMIKNSRQ